MVAISYTKVKRLALGLLTDHSEKITYKNLSGSDRIIDIYEAYDVQNEFVAMRKKRENDVIAGYKVGLTSNRMQNLLGIDSPIAGAVLKKRVFNTGKSVTRKSYGRVGLECEIIVMMDSDLPPLPGDKYSFEDIEAAVASVSPGFEIIDDREADYRDIDVLSLIADNSWNEGLVVGENVSSWGDLAQAEGRLERNGKFLDVGKGADVLGHPFCSVQWLANTLRVRGLKKGDCVATGSIIPTIFPGEEGAYCFHISGVGSVTVQVR